MPLRSYQQQAHEDVINGLKTTKDNLIVVIGTAGGKSHNIAALAEWVASFKDFRCCIITNRQELLLQNLSKINHDSVGIVSAGLKRFEYDKQIVLGGIQTIYNKHQLLGKINLIIVDECHGISNAISESMYWQFIKGCKDARLVGYTATPYRLNEGLLSWGKIVHNTSYEQLLKLGYVTPLTNKVSANPDLTKIKVSNGDYAMSDYMSKELHDSLPDVVAKVIAANRNKVLGFMPTMDSLRQASWLFAAHRIRAECITSKTPPKERKEILEAYANNEIRHLLNIDVLTTGFDCPDIDLVFCTRPTKSLALWLQMVGRNVRLYSYTNDAYQKYVALRK